MANSVDPDQTASIGAVYSGSTLFASILNLSVLLGIYLQQTTSADSIFRCIFFLGALAVVLSREQTIYKGTDQTVLVALAILYVCCSHATKSGFLTTK